MLYNRVTVTSYILPFFILKIDESNININLKDKKKII